jgi:hypothetical protein
MGTFSQVSENRRWVANAHFGRRSPHLGDLYDRLSSDVFPLLLAARFGRIDEAPAGFAQWTGGNKIVFQNRDQVAWPTIEFELGGRRAGFCKVHLGVLPPECWALSGERVPQEEAPVWMSPVYLALSRRSRRGRSEQEFGLRRFFWVEKAVIEQDVQALKRLLPTVFRHFEEGIPAAWRKAKHHAVHRNLVLVWGSWNPIRVNRSIPSGDYYKALT